MGEVQFVAQGTKVQFTGVFSLKGLYKVIDDYFNRLGYDKKEDKSVEAAKKDGKFVIIALTYDKSLNDYVKAVHKVSITGEGITPVDIKKNDIRKRMNKGKVVVEMDTYLESDYERRWEGKPFYYLMRIIWQKFVWAPMELGFKSETSDVVTHFVAEVKAYLNLGKY